MPVITEQLEPERTGLVLSLEKSAQIYKAYWHPSATHTLPNVCLEAGYEITDVDLKSKKVCFEK